MTVTSATETRGGVGYWVLYLLVCSEDGKEEVCRRVERNKESAVGCWIWPNPECGTMDGMDKSKAEACVGMMRCTMRMDRGKCAVQGEVKGVKCVKCFGIIGLHCCQGRSAIRGCAGGRRRTKPESSSTVH